MAKKAPISRSERVAKDILAGTMGELTPILEIDGRKITRETELFEKIKTAFLAKRQVYCEAIP